MLGTIMSVSLEILEVSRVSIFWLYAIATVGVILGVYWEHEEFEQAKRKRGWLLLLLSLGTETFLTIALFGIDSEISHRQQSTIEQLFPHATGLHWRRQPARSDVPGIRLGRKRWIGA